MTMASQDAYDTFVNNSLIIKVIPMAVLGLLAINMLFNAFLWVMEIKFGQILTKAKLLLLSLSFKGKNPVL